jgi:hypothetical protein
LKNDRTVAAVCHQEDQRIILDRIETWSGTAHDRSVSRRLSRGYFRHAGPITAPRW